MVKEPKNGTLVTGASDDLIELRGNLHEEFDAYDCDGGGIAFSDGTLLNVRYDEDGIWRFNLIYKGDLFKAIEQGSIEEDTNDIAYFEEGLMWCVFSNDMQSTGRRI